MFSLLTLFALLSEKRAACTPAQELMTSSFDASEDCLSEIRK
jgi:hypothetical protein